VYSGKIDSVPIYSGDFTCLVDKSKVSSVEIKYNIPEYLCAPVTSGEAVGKIEYYIGGALIGESDLYIKENIEKLTLIDIFCMIISRAICGKF
jgi:hypothetical protein